MIGHITSLRRLIQVGGLIAILVVATIGIGQDVERASASHTQIFFSYSSVSPIPESSILIHPGGERDLYIWAKDVDDSTGVSGFTLAIEFDETKVSLDVAPGDNNGIGDGAWLSSTGRQATCQPEQDPLPGRIVGYCNTLLQPPPHGPTGSGLLGRVVLTSGQDFGTTALHFTAPSLGVTSTHLVNTPVDPDDIQTIPATRQNSFVLFLRCADNNGDGRVDLPNDILGVILNYTGSAGYAPGEPGAQGTPGTKENYDLNIDYKIDLATDVLGTILQYDVNCVQQPLD